MLTLLYSNSYLFVTPDFVILDEKNQSILFCENRNKGKRYYINTKYLFLFRHT